MRRSEHFSYLNVRALISSTMTWIVLDDFFYATFRFLGVSARCS
jgi:hypothetical protein